MAKHNLIDEILANVPDRARARQNLIEEILALRQEESAWQRAQRAAGSNEAPDAVRRRAAVSMELVRRRLDLLELAILEILRASDP